MIKLPENWTEAELRDPKFSTGVASYWMQRCDDAEALLQNIRREAQLNTEMHMHSLRKSLNNYFHVPAKVVDWSVYADARTDRNNGWLKLTYEDGTVTKEEISEFMLALLRKLPRPNL